MSAHESSALADIIKITKQSAVSNDTIRIMELSTLNDFVPAATAESIRRLLLAQKAHIRQLTNQYVLRAWTTVTGYVATCMDIRYLPPDVLPITAEVLIFDSTVAIYGFDPKPWATVVRDPGYALQQKTLFDYFWVMAEPTRICSDGSTP